MKTSLSLEGEITPLVGYGTLKLLDNICVLRPTLLEDEQQYTQGTRVAPEWVVRYCFPDWNCFAFQNSILLYTSIYDGRILGMEFTADFTGQVNGIGLGNSAAEIRHVFAGLTFDENKLEVTELGLLFGLDNDEEIEDIESILHQQVTSIIIRHPVWYARPCWLT